MEAGAASELLVLSDQAGIRLAPEQRLLTPFQRMVLLLEMQRQQEEADNQNNLGSRTPNSAHQSGGGSMGNIGGETVTYTNESV